MSVLINGIDVPKNCGRCFAFDDYTGGCNLYSNGVVNRYNIASNSKPDWCELVELPPHGRLIDADKMAESVKTQVSFVKMLGSKEPILAEIADEWEKGILQEIANAPTVLEVES